MPPAARAIRSMPSVPTHASGRALPRGAEPGGDRAARLVVRQIRAVAGHEHLPNPVGEPLVQRVVAERVEAVGADRRGQSDLLFGREVAQYVLVGEPLAALVVDGNDIQRDRKRLAHVALGGFERDCVQTGFRDRTLGGQHAITTEVSVPSRNAIHRLCDHVRTSSAEEAKTLSMTATVTRRGAFIYPASPRQRPVPQRVSAGRTARDRRVHPRLDTIVFRTQSYVSISSRKRIVTVSDARFRSFPFLWIRKSRRRYMGFAADDLDVR